MKNFNNLPILILITINLLVFGSCEKHSDPKEVYKYYYLTPSQVAQSPYFTSNKYDTLSFFNTLGDTFTFAKIKTDTAFIKESSTEMGSEVTTYYNYQYLHNTYQTLKGNGKFEVWHYTKQKNGADNLIELSLTSKNIAYFADFVEIKQPEFKYYNEIVFVNQRFENVARFHLYGSEKYDIIQYNYVSKLDGLILSIDLKSNDSLFLVKK